MLTCSRNRPKRCVVFRLPLELFSLTWLGWFTAHIAEKENKLDLDALSDEKEAKIKKFAREYIHKVLH